MRTLGQRHLEARVAFAETGRRYADRKQAARETQAEVESLRSAVAVQPATKPPTDPLRLTRTGWRDADDGSISSR